MTDGLLDALLSHSAPDHMDRGEPPRAFSKSNADPADALILMALRKWSPQSADLLGLPDLRSREQVRRRNHTAPRVFLNAWATDGVITRTPISGGRATDQSLDDATVQKDFYVFEDLDGSRDDFWEVWFAEYVEGPARCGLDRVRRGQAPSWSERRALSVFLAAQALRTERSRHSLLRSGRWAEALHEVDPLREYPGEAEKLIHFVAFAKRLPEVTEAIYRGSWVLHTHNRGALVAGDNPVIPRSTQMSRMSALDDFDKTDFAAALGPRVSLAVYEAPHEYTRKACKVLRAEKCLTDTVNRVTVEAAQRAVFSTPEARLREPLTQRAANRVSEER